MTEAEHALWRLLKSRQVEGYRFRRQVPIGRYIADFLCHEARLIIEVDGGQHDRTTESETKRTTFLESQGYRVLRFWNNEVLGNPEGVYTRITENLSLDHPHPNPPPSRGRAYQHPCSVAPAGSLLTVDLDAIVGNWRSLDEKVAPHARCAAVVKADAYGLDAARVAPALYAAGCRRFVVAALEEGLALRPLLGPAEIHVLNGPFAGTEAEFVAAGLTPVLNSPEQIARWRAVATRLGRPLASVLHVDTGMSRLGLSAAEARGLAADADGLAAVQPVVLMSHLACADEPDHPMNRRQLTAFQAARALFPGLPGSLAASSGIFLGPDWHADWCRPGAALYGLNPSPGQPNPMRPVIRLDAGIIQVRDIDAGESVGYGATHRAPRTGRLAVAAAGYADGLFRALGNKGSGLLGGHRVPLVGRVSMDLVIFDVTGLPETLAVPGGTINLIGPEIAADDVGETAGTIGYEVLTALGSRYHRHYLGGTAS